MAKLHQILAIKNDKSKIAKSKITNAYQTSQKHGLFAGLHRVYQPLNDEGETFPQESTRAQVTVADVLNSLAQNFTTLFEVNAIVDWGNLNAVADIVVDDITLVTDAPATYLMWLEKELTDMLTALSALPTLDPAETWTVNSDGLYQTAPIATNKTKKVPTVIVKYEATPEHPAQTELMAEDKVVGFWTTTKTSGAVPATQVAELTGRVVKVRDAVKVARATANEVQVTQPEVSRLVDFVFNGE